MADFLKLVRANEREIFVRSVAEAHRSVQSGSELTGAPGQPVDTGHLRASWQLEWDIDAAYITTNAKYARGIEDGVGPHGPLTLQSKVGGFHSRALTIAGWSRIVGYVTRQVRGRK